MNPKRRVRNFLINSRFQLKYTLMVVLLSGVIASVLGYFLYQEHLRSSKILSLDPDLHAGMEDVLRDEDRRVLWYLAAFLGSMVLGLGGVGIIATHKIAGPAYSMRRTLSAIADGDLPKMRRLRRGDELKEVAQELRRMTEELRKRETAELDSLLELQRWTQDHPDTKDLETIKTILGAMIRQKERRLADDPNPPVDRA